MFTIQGGSVQIDVPEDFKVVMAYNDTDAINEVRKDYPMGVVLSIKQRANVEIKKIIDVVGGNALVPLISITQNEIDFFADPPETADRNVEKFLYALTLVSDNYIVDKRDRASLKRIINKIKPHESIATPEPEKNVA